MSGAKDRMRRKKLKNQPTNVTYLSQDCGDSQQHNRGGSSSDQLLQQPSCLPLKLHQPFGGKRKVQVAAVSHNKALPKYITASLFAKARAAEVNSMLRAVTKTTGSCHVFGSLPKHMRRRAMSHNTKRLPCRLREVAQRMMEKSQQTGKKEQSKTKSRSARRRHGSLLLEFNRRQRKNKWLETHIWHAKRFHMLKKWGYCLGDRPTCKSYRASYRAMSSSCLLQDLSYYCCLELCGPEDQLLNALSRLTSKDTGPTFAATLCVSGQREGSVMLYRPDQYPHQPLGPASFLWRPCSAEQCHRQLWLWMHPTLKQDVLPELQAVCQCFEPVFPVAEIAPSETPTREVLTGAASSDPGFGPTRTSRKRKLQSDSNAKRVLGDGTRSLMTPVKWKSSQTEIVISDLTMDIVRCRLIGPKSHIVLSEILLPAMECEVSMMPSLYWWPEQCKNQKHVSLHRQQADAFRLLRGVHSTAELPAGIVLGLTVDDPRLTFPMKQGKAMSDLQWTQCVDEEQRRNFTLNGVPSLCAQSALWEQSVRDNVMHNKISEQDLNRLKGDLLVPGSILPTPEQGRVPILLVHQAGKRHGEERYGWGSGWDLLLPKGWGMAFWLPLIYSGVHVGGLHMSLKHCQNKGRPHFPHDYPDCPAGTSYQEQQEIELLEKFKRYPPSKRPNYIKHGCLAPFRSLWQQLVEEWDEMVKQKTDIQDPETVKMEEVKPLFGESPTPTSAFKILRSRKVLRQLSIWCQQSSSHIQRIPRGCSTTGLCSMVARSLQAEWKRCLLWVRVCVLGKGRPALHAMLCIPAIEDLQQLRGDLHYSGPKELQHTDHLKSLKRRKQPDKAKVQCKAFTKDHDRTHTPSTVKATSELDPKNHIFQPVALHPYATVAESPSLTGCSDGLVQGLWSEPLPNIISHCSRVTLGWVTQGDFSLATGAGEALGFVSLVGFLQMLLSQPADLRGTMLLRNPSSLQYRYVRVHIEA